MEHTRSQSAEQPHGRRGTRRAIAAALLIVLLSIYAWEAHARRFAIPTPATQGDQDAYLAYARQMHGTHFSAVGERNRMPLFPFLLSFLDRDGPGEAEFLERAQAFNVNLSVGVLVALYLLWRTRFPDYYSLALTGATAFGVFLHRAVLAQAEVLFYLLFFAAFLLMWRMLRAPRLWLAVACGGVLALAQLTKASVLPAVILFVTISALKSWRRPRDLGLLALVVLTFLAVLAPYLQTSKRVFGRYFYNVNSTFYIWCDSWDEAKQWSDRHNDRTGWPAALPEEIPSASKYWREHSVAEIPRRFAVGLAWLSARNAKLFGWPKTLLLLAAVAGSLVARRWPVCRQLILRDPFVAIFVAGFFAGYLLLYAWYMPISHDSRFVVSLFLPAIFSLSTLISRVRAELLPVIAAILALFFVADGIFQTAHLHTENRGKFPPGQTY